MHLQKRPTVSAFISLKHGDHMAGKIGKDHGLAWGGDWAFKDKAHFQLDVLSIQDCHKIAFKHGELAVWAEIQSLL